MSQWFNPSAFVSDSKPAIEVISLNDGVLLCHIYNARARINNAVARRAEFIDSSAFPMLDGVQTGWIRLYLNGKSDRAKLAISLCLNAPMCAGFQGRVRFTLIDQSDYLPPANISQICSGSLQAVGDQLGCDTFADKNLLHVDSSRYIRKDQILFTVQLQKQGESVFPSFPNNILFALANP